MYKGKRAKSTKNIYVMASLVLLIAFAVGGTVAYISMKTDPVTNTFTLGTVPIKVVEKLEDGVKKEVAIKHEGDVDAYIRAKVIVNWVKWNIETNQYDVSGTPVNDSDYHIDWNTSNENVNSRWTLGNDGYYYYTEPVKPKTPTEDYLFTDCSPIKDKTPEGYTLSVEILAQSIQAGTSNQAIIDAWGVTIDENGNVNPVTTTQP